MALELLLSPETLPFTGAVGLSAVLAAVEIVGLVAGLSFSTADAEVVSGPDAGGGDALSAVLGWMNPGRLPLIAILMVFLAVFGLSGLAVQSLAALADGQYLPAGLAAVPALANSVPFTRWTGAALARVLPRDESYDPAPEALIGAVGSISIGPADHASPGRATVIDRHGNTHNLRVTPLPGDPPLPTGTAVEIAGYDGAVHRARPRSAA